MKWEKMSQERAEVSASARKGNGEGRTAAIRGPTRTSLRFIFSFLYHTCLLLFRLVLLLAKQTHFLRAQPHQHDIQHKLFCSTTRLSGVVSNSRWVDSPYHRILLILKNDIASKWDWANPQEKDPLMVMKYLDAPILQCEIQELPQPDTATVFRKSPTSCFLGSYSLPGDMSCLLLKETRCWAGYTSDQAQPLVPMFCKDLSSALHNIRRLYFIHLYCHAVHTSLYLRVTHKA